MENQEFAKTLYNEILVDAHDECEQNMSWYYYAQDELEFPFDAVIVLNKIDGEIERKKIKVTELVADEGFLDKNFELKVNVEFNDYLIAFSLSKLEEIDSTEKTIETIEIWKYWLEKH